MAEKQLKISGMVEEIVGEICNRYCKYQDMYANAEDEDKLMEHCEQCPFQKI